MWKPRKNGSATMVSMTSNRTSLEAAAVDAGTTKRAEAGRIPCLPAAFATPSSSSLTSTLGGALLLLSFSGFISVICHSRYRHAPGEHPRPCRHFVAEAAGGWWGWG